MNELSCDDTLVTVIGGSGFLGRHVVRALAKRGYRIRVACRRPDLAGHLQPLGRVGQIHAVQANLRYPESIEAAVKGADVVVNLVGILFERGGQTFEAISTRGAETVARATAAANARLVQVSAIGVENPHSAYARAKAEGERLVREILPSTVILRPSIVFGPEDDFFNMFAGLARISPFLPLIGGGTSRFQPVFAGDAAAAVALAVDGAAKPGMTYELGGPDVLTFRQIMEYILKVTERWRLLVPLPYSVGRLMGFFMQLLPKPLLTMDQVELLKRDNVVSAEAIAEGRTLQGLGITPTTMNLIVPNYLWRFRKTGQFRKPVI